MWIFVFFDKVNVVCSIRIKELDNSCLASELFWIFLQESSIKKLLKIYFWKDNKVWFHNDYSPSPENWCVILWFFWLLKISSIFYSRPNLFFKGPLDHGPPEKLFNSHNGLSS